MLAVNICIAVFLDFFTVFAYMFHVLRCDAGSGYGLRCVPIVIGHGHDIVYIAVVAINTFIFGASFSRTSRGDDVDQIVFMLDLSGEFFGRNVAQFVMRRLEFSAFAHIFVYFQRSLHAVPLRIVVQTCFYVQVHIAQHFRAVRHRNRFNGIIKTMKFRVIGKIMPDVCFSAVGNGRLHAHAYNIAPYDINDGRNTTVPFKSPAFFFRLRFEFSVCAYDQICQIDQHAIYIFDIAVSGCIYELCFRPRVNDFIQMETYFVVFGVPNIQRNLRGQVQLLDRSHGGRVKFRRKRVRRQVKTRNAASEQRFGYADGGAFAPIAGQIRRSVFVETVIAEIAQRFIVCAFLGAHRLEYNRY